MPSPERELHAEAAAALGLGPFDPDLAVEPVADTDLTRAFALKVPLKAVLAYQESLA